ncbi:MAG: FliO/MopB family protein [Candidatus Hydrogenedentes bacterium]|nr:FliO/MopB family protein [Candidatus Hydrogenedentota bacterium]
MRRAMAMIVAAYMAALAFAAGAPALDEFGQTAPPKVNLPQLSGVESGGGDGQHSANPDQAGDQSPTGDPLLDAVGAFMREDPAAAAPDPPEAPAPGEAGFSPVSALMNALFALCAVLGIFFLLVYLTRRLGRRTPIVAGQKLAQVIGRVALSPQASLHFVRTNDQVLVIGVTQHTVNLLQQFDAADFDVEPDLAAARAEAPESGASFLDQLRSVQDSMPAAPAVDQDIDSLKGDLQRLKKYFQDSARARE